MVKLVFLLLWIWACLAQGLKTVNSKMLEYELMMESQFKEFKAQSS